MRFDYFDIFWNMYEKELKRLGINKETAREIYEMNYSTLNLLGEQNKDSRKKLYYEDGTLCEKDKYITFMDNDGRVIIRPFYANESVGNLKGKKTIFDKRNVETLSTMDDNLMLESFTVNSRNLSIQIYDKEALNYLKGHNITYIDFDSIDNIKDMIYDRTHLIPDINLTINQTDCKISTPYDSYSELANDTIFLYKDFRSDARRLIKTINERK